MICDKLNFNSTYQFHWWRSIQREMWNKIDFRLLRNNIYFTTSFRLSIRVRISTSLALCVHRECKLLWKKNTRNGKLCRISKAPCDERHHRTKLEKKVESNRFVLPLFDCSIEAFGRSENLWRIHERHLQSCFRVFYVFILPNCRLEITGIWQTHWNPWRCC